MTLEISVDDTRNIVRLKNTGVRTSEIVAQAVETIENQYEKSGSVRVLVDWSAFKGQPDAVKGLLMNVARASLMIERAAIVAPPELEWEASHWQDIIEEVLIRRFPVEKYKEAEEWLSEPNY